LENHYNYVFDHITSTYNFTTKNNILYRIAFVVDERFSELSGEEIPNVFQLVVEKASEETEPYDSKVSKTIENIIERFFRKIENSLVYVCSDEDKKGKIRHDIFDRWYKKSEFKESIIKMDNIIKINISKLETLRLYTSFMFHKENSSYEQLVGIYNQIEQILNSDK